MDLFYSMVMIYCFPPKSFTIFAVLSVMACVG